MPAAPSDKEAALKRLGGGRWQTRDERFTIEPQSGTWVIVDAEQSDDLGLPLVRGPFPSLTAAKDAIAEARATPSADSPLPARAKAIQARPVASAPSTSTGAASDAAGGRATRAQTPKPVPPPEPVEPRWIADLAPDERRRARRTIEALSERGASDAEGIARRDIAGKVPAIAAYAVEQAIRDLGPDARPPEVASALADGQDRALGVRWRLVDGEGRPITIDPKGLRRE